METLNSEKIQTKHAGKNSNQET